MRPACKIYFFTDTSRIHLAIKRILITLYIRTCKWLIIYMYMKKEIELYENKFKIKYQLRK